MRKKAGKRLKSTLVLSFLKHHRYRSVPLPFPHRSPQRSGLKKQKLNNRYRYRSLIFNDFYEKWYDRYLSRYISLII